MGQWPLLHTHRMLRRMEEMSKLGLAREVRRHFCFSLPPLAAAILLIMVVEEQDLGPCVHTAVSLLWLLHLTASYVVG